MTREQMAADLLTLVIRIGNELPAEALEDVPDVVRQAEWAYVKGLASSAVLTLRDRLLSVEPTTSLSALLEHSGPSRKE